MSQQATAAMADSGRFTVKGSIVAIVTPMLDDGAVDWPTYRKLVNWHVDQGTDSIVAVGTTGESPTLPPEEHGEVIRVTVEEARGRIPVIAGSGGNSTSEAIELTRFAKSVGAQASLQVVPYYNKPTQEGMYRHFRAIAEAVDLPIILYNVPGRTVVDLKTETTLRLAEVPGIVGLKDATGDLPRAVALLRKVSSDFLLYSGNDDSALALMAVGGHGVISVTANIAPRLMAKMCRAALQGDFAQARLINNQLFPLHTDVYVEPNPTGIKYLMAQKGLCRDVLRLPLLPLSEENKALLLTALHDSNLD